MFPTGQSQYAPRRPEGPVAGPNGSTLVPSSFGAANTTFGPQFSAHDAIGSERSRLLAYRESFFRCTAHDHKPFDFQGRATPPGLLHTQPLLGAQLPTHYVPLDMRRPNDPYRLAKLVVTAFTGLVFGEGMWPRIKADGDGRTEDFASELARAQKLPAAMVRARNVGGSCGAVGLSWRFCGGLPRVAIHRPQIVHVLEWEDYEGLVPAHVVRLIQVDRAVVNKRDGRRSTMRFWQRRDWTPEADVFYAEEPVDPKHEPDWKVEREEPHGDGFCHFVWIRNVEDADESSVDGLPDYEGLYENLGTLDVLSSVVTRGGVLNLDPTLKLKMDPEIVSRYGVRKGSDNAIVVGKDGDADYMELDGTSLTAGGELIARRRKHALETAQCVVPDPDTISAAGTSAAGLKLVYRPMLGAGNLLRDAYGAGIVRLLGQQIDSARRLLSETVDVPEQIETPTDDPEARAMRSGLEVLIDEREQGGGIEEQEAQEGPQPRQLELRPRSVEEELVDENGKATGESIVRYEERDPGESDDLSLVWPDYFEPTPADRQQEMTTLSLASGGKPVLSRRSCVEKAAAIEGLDPAEEWARVQEQERQERAEQGLMFPDVGGELPSGTPEAAPDGQEAVGEDGAREGASEAPQEPADPLEAPGAAQVVAVTSANVLNGAQIGEAVDIVAQVVQGTIPRDSGLAMLEAFFNLVPGAALKIMGSAGLPVAPPTVSSLRREETPPPGPGSP